MNVSASGFLAHEFRRIAPALPRDRCFATHIGANEGAAPIEITVVRQQPHDAARWFCSQLAHAARGAGRMIWHKPAEITQFRCGDRLFWMVRAAVEIA